jgi:hypothetical protein
MPTPLRWQWIRKLSPRLSSMMVFSARFRRVLPVFVFALFAARAALACSGRAHVEIAESGIYALDYAALVAAQPGLADCRADDLALLQRDKEIPMRIVGDEHGVFGPSSRIEWLGEALHGPQSWFDQYSNVNVYQIVAAPGAHARVREVAAPAGGEAAPLRRRAHFEREELMIRLGDREMKPGEEPDVWQWAKLTPIDAQPFAFDFDLADLRPGGSAALTLDFRGESSITNTKPPKPADHRVEVLVNDKLVQTLEWDGRDEIRRTFEVPVAVLRDKGNRLNLRVPRRDAPGDAGNFIVDVAMFNWFEVAYPISGSLDADIGGFGTMGATPVQLTWSGSAPLVLFGSDGTLRAAAPLSGGHYRAAGAAENVDLYPLAGAARKPLLVRAVAATDLRAERAGYDYVMVVHPRLREAIEPLARYHAAHGHTVIVVDVNDIYDDFNGGIVHPAAIRDYLAWATQHWAMRPRFLLLVGDASADIHHDIRTADKEIRRAPNFTPLAAAAPGAHLPPSQLLLPGGFGGMDTVAYKYLSEDLPNRNLIPTWQVPSSPEGQSASDIPYVALKPGDFHPQLAIGRLPVVEPAEVSAIVKKTLAYLTDATPGRWRHDMTFISTSEVEAFKGESDRLAASLQGEGYAVRSIYTDPHEPVEVGKAKRAALKQDLDDGSLIVHFLGHGGNYIWRVGGPTGDLFTLDDVGALRNAGRYPLVLAMTCFSAPFDNPIADSIGERFLREADKGAIAVFGASWSNSPVPAHSRALLQELMLPGATIGEAINKAKAKQGDHTFVEMYNLLGDPAVVLARPKQTVRIEASGQRWDKRVLVQLPMNDFRGTVDVDWADAQGDIVASRRYESHDRMFYLDMPQRAQKAIVYAADTRDGTQAFGGYGPPPSPPPKPVATPRAAPAPVAVTPIASAAAAVPPRNLPDAISRLGFDTATPEPAAQPKPKQH